MKGHTQTLLFVISFAVITIISFALGTSAAEDDPPLTVITPEEGLLTNNATLHVTGTMKPRNFVSVHVENSTGNSTYTQFIGTSNGTFNITVQLAEGRNELSIGTGSLPPSDNVTIVERVVRLNTVYPVFTVQSPDPSPVYTNQLRYQIIGTVYHPEYPVRIPEYPLPYNQ